MHVPKSADQELADGHLRQLKRLLMDGTKTMREYDWQCRYQLRRAGVVSRQDPSYAMDAPGRPKFWPVACIEVSGKPFLDKTMLSTILEAPMGDLEVATL